MSDENVEVEESYELELRNSGWSDESIKEILESDLVSLEVG